MSAHQVWMWSGIAHLAMPKRLRRLIGDQRLGPLPDCWCHRAQDYFCGDEPFAAEDACLQQLAWEAQGVAA